MMSPKSQAKNRRARNRIDTLLLKPAEHFDELVFSDAGGTFPAHHLSRRDDHDITASTMMLSYVEIEPHAVVEEHRHPHEQVGMVIEGKALFVIGGQEKVLHQKGDRYRIPGNVKHRVTALGEPSRGTRSVWPIREDYL